MSLPDRDLAAAMACWPQLAGAVPRLINHSENHTFLCSAPGGTAYTLRLHRPHYQNTASIESELAWLAALQEATDLPIPDPVPGRDGRLLQAMHAADGAVRHAVLFRFISGVEPRPEENLEALFGTLGRYAAGLHDHAATWQRPAGFVRQAWTAGAILDPNGLWGDWRIAPGVDATILPMLQRLDTELRRRLAAYGQSSDRYGLIHADMRLGNLLVDGERVSLIDFDDCGFSWFVYDFAASISFHETHPSLPALRAAWLDGYRRMRPLTGADIAAIDTMVLLRRMALLAWIGTHIETDLARGHAPGFAQGTADLADRYLSGRLWS